MSLFLRFLAIPLFLRNIITHTGHFSTDQKRAPFVFIGLALFSLGGIPANGLWGQINREGLISSASADSGWTQVGLARMDVRTLVTKGSNLFAGTWGNGMFLSTDGGTTWKAINNGLGEQFKYVLALAIKDTVLFAGTVGSGVIFSKDNGASWGVSDSTLTSVEEWTYSLAVQGDDLFASTTSTVFRSTNNGATWIEADSGLGLAPALSLLANGTTLIAGGNGVHLLTDHGASWQAAGLNGIEIISLAVKGSKLYAGTFNKAFYVSTDTGAHWTERAGSSALGGVASLLAIGPNLFVGTQLNGLFRYNENGTSEYFAGLKNSRVTSLAIQGPYLIAGLADDGVWRRPISEMTSNTERKETPPPKKFLLENNYPNPFNPSTVITYQLPENSYATLRVFDILGREVATLVNDEVTAGSHSVTWNGERFASGLFFYRIETTGPNNSHTYFSQVKKMLLVK